MRVILVQLRRATSYNDLSRRVFGEVDVLQSLPLLLPMSFLFGRRRFPGSFRVLRGVGDFGFCLGECCPMRTGPLMNADER
jgi:hypothetical protein